MSTEVHQSVPKFKLIDCRIDCRAGQAPMVPFKFDAVKREFLAETLLMAPVVQYDLGVPKRCPRGS